MLSDDVFNALTKSFYNVPFSLIFFLVLKPSPIVTIKPMIDAKIPMMLSSATAIPIPIMHTVPRIAKANNGHLISFKFWTPSYEAICNKKNFTVDNLENKVLYLSLVYILHKKLLCFHFNYGIMFQLYVRKQKCSKLLNTGRRNFLEIKRRYS